MSDNKFENITYDDFRTMSGNDSLTPHEKIGFPNSYRAGKSKAILQDICAKTTALTSFNKTIADIGCGCGDLTLTLIEHCKKRQHHLLLFDSNEVLSQLPDAPHITKIDGRFPQESKYDSHPKCDAVIAYSMLHYVYAETCVFTFLDYALNMLARGGSLLLGDIPNISMRNRFFSSQTGKDFHRQFTGKNEDPQTHHYIIEQGKIDDSVILSLLLRARTAGYHSYVMPQHSCLPMANRREDLLFTNP